MQRKSWGGSGSPGRLLVRWSGVAGVRLEEELRPRGREPPGASFWDQSRDSGKFSWLPGLQESAPCSQPTRFLLGSQGARGRELDTLEAPDPGSLP